MEEELFVSLERTWVGISAKPSYLHDPDKRSDGIDPAIEYFSFLVDQKIEGNMAKKFSIK